MLRQMRRVIISFVCVAFLLLHGGWEVLAQRYAVSVNAGDLAALGTMNATVETALGNNWSVESTLKYNPWTFAAGDPDTQLENRQFTIYAGGRYWPWTVFSEWWFAGGPMWQAYNRGGVFGRETEEGSAIGVRVAAGYSLMVAPRFNLDFGFGLWGGWTEYRLYACPFCGRLIDEGGKWFFLPSEAVISAVITF